MDYDAVAESGRNPVSKHQVMSGLRRGTGRSNASPKFSGVNRDREKSIFPVKLTTSRIGNHTRLIHTLLKVLTIHVYTHILNIIFIFPSTSSLHAFFYGLVSRK